MTVKSLMFNIKLSITAVRWNCVWLKS